MDPVSITMIITAILSIAVGIRDAAITDFKNKARSSINSGASALKKLLAEVYQTNSDKIDALNNRLMNLGFIQQTPALRKAIGQMYNEAKSKITKLKQERIDLENKEQIVDLKEAEIYDQESIRDIKNKNKEYNKYQGDLKNEAEEILKKYQE